jgi:tetratricopeptide (TPR) repeat protein
MFLKTILMSLTMLFISHLSFSQNELTTNESSSIQSNLSQFLMLQDSAQIFYDLGNLSQAKKYLLKSKEVFAALELQDEASLLKYSETLNLLGGIYKNEGNFRNASSTLGDALHLRKELAMKDSTLNLYYGETLLNIGHLNYLKENNRTAESNFLLAIEKLKPFENSSFYLAEAYGHLGLIYQEWKYYNDALKNFQQSLGFYNKHPSNVKAKFQIALIERRMGITHFFLKNYVTTGDLLNSSVSSLREIVATNANFDTEAELVRSMMLIGQINIEKLSKYELGIAQLEEALKIGNKYPNSGDYLFNDYLEMIRKLLRKYR